MSRLRSAAVALLAVSCAKAVPFAPVDAGDSGTGPCATYLPPERVGTVPAALGELSGMVESDRHPGIWFAHNDSGNDFELFALKETGEIVATWTLTGANPSDLEALALAPCSEGSAERCVYLADIGDNLKVRDDVRLYRLPQPATLANGSISVEVLRFAYPDGARNAETLISDPKTGKLYVVSKYVGGLGEVFRLDDLAPGSTGTATRVRTLPAIDNTSTAGDVHPDGTRMLLRTYGKVWELRNPDAKNVEELLDGKALSISAPTDQFQSESLGYALDGKSYLVGTEGAGGQLYRVRCR